MIVYRWFQTTHQGALCSFITNEPWPPEDVHEATCRYHVVTPEHPVPWEGCSCGFYSYKYPEDALVLPKLGYRCHVFTACEVWGEMYEHEYGVRSQFCAVRAIWQTRGKRVHDVYQVDRYKRLEDMLERWEVGVDQDAYIEQRVQDEQALDAELKKLLNG